MTTLLLTNAHLIDPATGREGPGAVLVRDDRIADIHWGKPASVPEGAEVIECGGQVLTAGLVGLRAFVGEPGAEHRETIASASRAAAAGGVTSFIMMPDTDPVIDDIALVEYVLKTARDKAVVNVYPAAALTKGLAGEEMSEFGLLLEAGAVCLTNGRNPLHDTLVLSRALTVGPASDRTSALSER